MQKLGFRLLLIALLVLAVGGSCFAQNQSKRNDRRREPASTPQLEDENKKSPDPTSYSYEFAQPQFVNRHIVVEHDAMGRGNVMFERQGEDTPITEPLELSTGALGRILRLWSELRFLDSKENYQASKQFPHLGTYHLHMNDGKRRRTAEFNWSDNKTAWALIDEYRRVADQAIFIFDLKTARENQPLNTPTLMNALETLFTRNGLSDPHQLVPLLKELRTDEHIPLIARNHADRLLKRIEKQSVKPKANQ